MYLLTVIVFHIFECKGSETGGIDEEGGGWEVG
jgi:hypothetical protein